MHNSIIKSNGALTALLTITLFSIASAQAPAANAPNDMTLRVDQLFGRFDRPDSPGCALGVIKDGKLIYKKGYGMANLEHDIPISPTKESAL
jgi:CubicO group peptidase (beta-lactamase class C family)